MGDQSSFKLYGQLAKENSPKSVKLKEDPLLDFKRKGIVPCSNPSGMPCMKSKVINATHPWHQYIGQSVTHTLEAIERLSRQSQDSHLSSLTSCSRWKKRVVSHSSWSWRGRRAGHCLICCFATRPLAAKSSPRTLQSHRKLNCENVIWSSS